MDKVFRYFSIKDETFYMFSRVEGEFGFQELQTAAPLDVVDVSIQQQKAPGSADIDFAFRLGEMHYFLQVFNMFNPKNKVDYGLQEADPQTS